MAGRKRHVTLAAAADRFALYQVTVQDAEVSAACLADIFRRLRKRPARRLREDFCGAAATACAWVRLHSDNSAVGLDIDDEPLAWGVRNNVGALPPAARRRIRLVRRDVLHARPTLERLDVISAMNNSWATFRDRATLLRYFRGVRRCLAQDGVFVMQLFGGRDGSRPLTQRSRRGGMRYEWEQLNFNAITSVMDYEIHYGFRDGSWLRRAFRYHWRVWGLTEVRDLLADAGFAESAVLWPTRGQRGRLTGRYSATRQAPGSRSWDVLIVAVP